MSCASTSTAAPAMGCDDQNTLRIAVKRATPDSEMEQPDTKKAHTTAEAVVMGPSHCKAEQAADDVDLVEHTVEQALRANVDVSRWQDSSGVRARSEDVHCHLEVVGKVGRDAGETAMVFRPRSTFYRYVEDRAIEGGIPDEDCEGYDQASSEICERANCDYDRVMEDVAGQVEQLRWTGDLPACGFTFEIDDDGSVCNVTLC